MKFDYHFYTSSSKNLSLVQPGHRDKLNKGVSHNICMPTSSNCTVLPPPPPQIANAYCLKVSKNFFVTQQHCDFANNLFSGWGPSRRPWWSCLTILSSKCRILGLPNSMKSFVMNEGTKVTWLSLCTRGKKRQPVPVLMQT